jgi:hypothetical protein
MVHGVCVLLYIEYLEFFVQIFIRCFNFIFFDVILVFFLVFCNLVRRIYQLEVLYYSFVLISRFFNFFFQFFYFIWYLIKMPYSLFTQLILLCEFLYFVGKRYKKIVKVYLLFQRYYDDNTKNYTDRMFKFFKLLDFFIIRPHLFVHLTRPWRVKIRCFIYFIFIITVIYFYSLLVLLCILFFLLFLLFLLIFWHYFNKRC